jgi:multicomponent Na+:H+ antiporter subunit E
MARKAIGTLVTGLPRLIAAALSAAAGVIAIVAATWTSLSLLPPGSARFSPTALAHLALRFVCQSIVAGVRMSAGAR